MQAGNARPAEEENSVIPNLPFDELILVELLPTDRTSLLVHIRARERLRSRSLESDERDEENQDEEEGGKNGERHRGAVILLC